MLRGMLVKKTTEHTESPKIKINIDYAIDERTLFELTLGEDEKEHRKGGQKEGIDKAV